MGALILTMLNKEELLEKAKKDYPKGTKYISPYSSKEYEVYGDFYYYGDYYVCEKTQSFVYYKGKWAEIVSKPKPKTKFNFKLGEKVIWRDKEHTIVGFSATAGVCVKGPYGFHNGSDKDYFFDENLDPIPPFYDGTKTYYYANEQTLKKIKTVAKSLDLVKTKIWIGNNPELSKKVQLKAFELGWHWAMGEKNVQHTDKTALCFWPDKDICHMSDISQEEFTKKDYREIFPEDFGIFDYLPVKEATMEKEKPFDKHSENWCVLRTKENAKIINDWFIANNYGTPTANEWYISTSGIGCYNSDITRPPNKRVLSFEEFRTLVLEEPIKKMKKLEDFKYPDFVELHSEEEAAYFGNTIQKYIPECKYYLAGQSGRSNTIFEGWSADPKKYQHYKFSDFDFGTKKGPECEVVHCETIEQWNIVNQHLPIHIRLSASLWNDYKEKTCKNLKKDQYSGLEWYKGKNSKVYSFNEWCVLAGVKVEIPIKKEPVNITSAFGLKIGDLLPEKVLNEFGKESVIWNGNKFKSITFFIGDRKIESFKEIGGEICFSISGTVNMHGKVKEYSEFIKTFSKESLSEEAKRRYPIGTTYKCASIGQKHTVQSMNWEISGKEDVIYAETLKGCFYINGKWAEIVEYDTIKYTNTISGYIQNIYPYDENLIIEMQEYASKSEEERENLFNTSIKKTKTIKVELIDENQPIYF